MGYLFAEILLYLVAAGFIGFIVGWFVRGELMVERIETSKEPKKEESKTQEPSHKIKEEKVEAADDEASSLELSALKEDKTEASIAPKEEEQTTNEHSESKPMLLSKAPAKGKDQLSLIKGIGPVLEKKLNELGVYTFEQIASWSKEQEAWISSQIAFPKRVTREAWVKQAKALLKDK